MQGPLLASYSIISAYFGVYAKRHDWLITTHNKYVLVILNAKQYTVFKFFHETFNCCYNI